MAGRKGVVQTFEPYQPITKLSSIKRASLDENDILDKMIDLFTQRPSDHPYIQSAWKARITGTGSHILPARGSWDFIFIKRQDSSSALLVAPSKIATISEYAEEEAEYFGIKLTPGFFPTHLNANTMLNGVQNLRTLASSVKVKSTNFEIPTFDNVELFVDKLLRQGTFDNDPIVQSELLGLNSPNITQRSIQRRFLRSTGIPRPHFQRINRATHAEALLLHGDPIADVVCKAGYYDQSHLIRSLKALRGYRPSEVRDSSRR